MSLDSICESAPAQDPLEHYLPNLSKQHWYSMNFMNPITLILYFFHLLNPIKHMQQLSTTDNCVGERILAKADLCCDGLKYITSQLLATGDVLLVHTATSKKELLCLGYELQKKDGAKDEDKDGKRKKDNKDRGDRKRKKDDEEEED